MLLAVSVLGRLVWALLLPNGLNVVDLHVYVSGSASLMQDHLYDYTYSEKTPDFPLPFTYPPFAALVFFPLHFLPFTLVGIVWLMATIGALYWVAQISLELILGDAAHDRKWRAVAMAWTVVGMWSEPVRTTLDYGQVNVFLMLGAMLAVRSSRWWLSGLLVGFVGGIKLIPAIAGLYFAARRRWATVICSAVAFGATVGVSYLLIGRDAARYFGTLLGDATRIGPVGSVWNQSLRGALSRLVGYDVQSGPLWIAGVLVLAVLALAAWRSLGSQDRLGTLIVVELFGLMVSPISWSHHWVWSVPMLIWLLHGPVRQWAGATIVAGYWLVNIMVGVPWILSFFQSSIWPIPRPWPLAVLGAVDAFGVVVLYVWLINRGRAARAVREVAAAVIVEQGKLLLARRTAPVELAGMWELPGGKVEAGETAPGALQRELREELGVRAVVGPRFGVDVALPGGRVLRAYQADIESGTPAALAHSAIRWVDAAELAELDLVPNDRIWLDDLRGLLSEPVH